MRYYLIEAVRAPRIPPSTGYFDLPDSSSIIEWLLNFGDDEGMSSDFVWPLFKGGVLESDEFFWAVGTSLEEATEILHRVAALWLKDLEASADSEDLAADKEAAKAYTTWQSGPSDFQQDLNAKLGLV